MVPIEAPPYSGLHVNYNILKDLTDVKFQLARLYLSVGAREDVERGGDPCAAKHRRRRLPA
jgi:hypothetical protein